MAAISLQNVCKSFGGTAALRDVSMGVATGDRIALLGPSGSGKTTMLRLIAGLELPTSGTLCVNGEPVALTARRTAPVAMVFQNLALFPHLTAFENIALGLRVRKIAKAEIATRIEEISTLLAISGFLQRKPHELSAGERQRVALARALVKRPSVLLLDEPFANVDSHLRSELRAELKRLHSWFAMTMICVTHDLIEAFTLGQRVAVLNRGVLEQFDTPERLLNTPASAFVQSFLAFREIPEIVRQLLHDRSAGASLPNA